MENTIDNETFDIIINRIRRVPPWLNIEKTDHKIIFRFLRNAVELLTNYVLVDQIINEEEFERFVTIFELELTEILNEGFDLMIAVYFTLYNDFLLRVLVEGEYYRQAETLKRIMEWYFNDKINLLSRYENIPKYKIEKRNRR